MVEVIVRSPHSLICRCSGIDEQDERITKDARCGGNGHRHGRAIRHGGDESCSGQPGHKDPEEGDHGDDDECGLANEYGTDADMLAVVTT